MPFLHIVSHKSVFLQTVVPVHTVSTTMQDSQEGILWAYFTEKKNNNEMTSSRWEKRILLGGEIELGLGYLMMRPQVMRYLIARLNSPWKILVAKKILSLWEIKIKTSHTHIWIDLGNRFYLFSFRQLNPSPSNLYAIRKHFRSDISAFCASLKVLTPLLERKY